MRGFTPPRELYRALHPFTSIGKGSDYEVPPTKPKTRTIERITQHRCNNLPRTSIGFNSTHPPRGTHCKDQQEMTGDIAQGACHRPLPQNEDRGILDQHSHRGNLGSLFTGQFDIFFS
ncbi:hypothetical protein CRG98_049554 [Punica granatum]|uniref:Uncharacterized protein n=1 Tax=Punica granatum TaxID=22663 RepID=A0A2I0HE92_PUNGR|nr:hypothetical protein CRG98_049554 [Punica granatum]